MTPLAVLLAVVIVGLALGRLTLFGITFGTSAILFVALVAGHWGWTLPDGFETLGLAIFVYCVGISAGPTFFRGLAARGRTMAALGAIIILSGVAVAWCAARLLNLPPELVGGLMAGAMTSTPALGAIAEAGADRSSVAVGFGVAYPIGIVAVVVFVQVALKWSAHRASPEAVNAEILRSGSDDESFKSAIERRSVEILNPAVVGKRPSELSVLADSCCQISRVRAGERWRPMPSDFAFSVGSQVMLVGALQEITRVAEALGTICDSEQPVLDADRERRQVVVTAKEVYGKTLRDLRLQSDYGVTVVRVRRHDIEFVPSSRTEVEFGDTLTLVGESAKLAEVSHLVGHRPRTVNETDLLSLVTGLGLGILVGNLSLTTGNFSFSLGTAGGPLMVGLVLGHFRRIGPLRASLPPAAQLLLTEGGLAIFLAAAGIEAGSNIAAVIFAHGPILLFAALAIATIPLAIGFAVAKLLFRLTLLQSLGSCCGGMTSTPGLAVLTSATDSSQPVTSYVAAYPVALVLITIIGPMLLEMLKSMQ
jgi:putative transport protein